MAALDKQIHHHSITVTKRRQRSLVVSVLDYERSVPGFKYIYIYIDFSSTHLNFKVTVELRRVSLILIIIRYDT